MTRVSGTGGAGPVGPSARPRAGGGGGFALPGATASSATSPAAPAGATAAVSLAAMLAAQSGAAEEPRDRAARRHGQTMLKLMAGLQSALLGGDDPGAALERLASLADTIPAAADPRLGEVMAEIGLRARIELARRGA